MTRYQQRICEQIDELVSKMTGDELVEIGIGLAGKGLFRAMEKDGAKAANKEIAE